jgi:hypothetical protein
LQWRLRKSPAVPFQVLNDGLGDLEAAFFNYVLADPGIFTFFRATATSKISCSSSVKADIAAPPLECHKLEEL